VGHPRVTKEDTKEKRDAIDTKAARASTTCDGNPKKTDEGESCEACVKCLGIRSRDMFQRKSSLELTTM
jgi:hypothetical protein